MSLPVFVFLRKARMRFGCDPYNSAFNINLPTTVLVKEIAHA